MRAWILAAGAAVALTACGGANDDDSVDTLAVNNLVVDGDANMMGMDGNAMIDPATGLPVNAADPATQNAMEQDLVTNDADTNLANGL